MDLFKDSSKERQDLGGSSIPFLSEGKQIVQGHKDYTHFISLPLAIYPKLKGEVEGFRDSILGKNNKKPVEFQSTLDGMRVQESMFVSPSLLHLTVVMLNLENNLALVKAKNILEKISPSVRHALDKRPVSIQLKGLDCMQESLDVTQVLYAPVQEVGNEGRLRRACHVMIDAFVEAGFAPKDAKSNLKLHVTMMNVVYREDKSKGGTFDAREIHKVFGKKDWGEYEIKEAHISKRVKGYSRGYFHSDGSLTFPASEKDH